jgi:hypothetical protein
MTENDMRALLVFPLAALAACASTNADSLKRMSTAEVCYVGMVEPEHRQMVDAELQARNANCQDHAAEIAKLQSMEQRAGGTGPADTSSAAKPASGGYSGMSR